jgi:hypothetical protein
MSKQIYTEDQILKCLLDGYNITETLKICHCGYDRILPVIEKMKELGRPVNRYGKFKKEYERKKSKVRMEFLDRSGKKNWKKYMMANPFYFQGAFNKEFSKEAVIDAANQIF